MANLPVHPPEWIDAAPIRVERSIEIAAPPSVVWARIVDHPTWPEWFTALDAVQVTGAASGVGGSRRVTANRMSMDEKFTVWDPDEHFAFAVIGTKLPILAAMAESVTLQPVDGGCRVTYCQGLAARRGFGRVLDAIWRRQGAPALDEALSNLKRLCE